MTKSIRVFAIIAVGMAILSGCGGGGGGSQDGSGLIALQIENAYKPANIELPSVAGEDAEKATPNKAAMVDPLLVTKFRVTVSGEDLETPIVSEADAEAEQIQVLGIPPGTRDVLIEAYNGYDEVLRRRLIPDITIRAGVVTPIQTTLNTIPIILNYRSNAVVLKDYFRIHGFGEPEASLTIEAQGSDNLVLDLCLDLNGQQLLVSPDGQNGLFDFSPKNAVIGKQDVKVTDTGNGESSSKAITIVNAENRPGFKFVSAGSVNRLITIGTGFGSTPGVNYPLVLSASSEQ